MHCAQAPMLHMRLAHTALVQGVTTLLFPLSVIKTRQMSSHGIPGGFAVSCR